MTEHINNVHSAVLGMLTLSQQPYGSHSQGDTQQQTLLGNQFQPQNPFAAANGQMPLTPPGSPPEDQIKAVAPASVSIMQPPQQQQMACDYTGGTGTVFTTPPQCDIQPTDVDRVAQLPSTSSTQVPNNNGYGGYDVFGAFNQLAGSVNNDFFNSPLLTGAFQTNSTSSRRNRSEKKPIPAEQKDDKYYQRRRKNNDAAKRSRDHRKLREDDIATKAAYLERENAVLRAQVATLREEANNLRALQFQKQQSQMIHARMFQQHSMQHQQFNGATATA